MDVTCPPPLQTHRNILSSQAEFLPKEEAFEATALGPGSYIGELGLFYDRTCMENVSVRGEESATLWQLKRSDFFQIIDRLEEEIVEGGECEMPEMLDKEPASLFVVSDGSGYSAGGAVNLALKQFENQYTKNCDTVNVTSFPYIRYKGEIQQVAKRARQENALIVYTLMRKEPRQAMLDELKEPAKEGENPFLGDQCGYFADTFSIFLHCFCFCSIPFRCQGHSRPALQVSNDIPRAEKIIELHSE